MTYARNPYPAPSALEKALLRELVTVARRCYERGWSHGTAGNFSLRGRDGLVWQGPSGLNKGEIDPAQFIAIDQASDRQVAPVIVLPSGEMPSQLGAYRPVPRAKCVVHSHPPALVEASRSGDYLIFQGEEMQKHLG